MRANVYNKIVSCILYLKKNFYLCFMTIKKQQSAGQPKKFGEASKVLTIRVPLSKFEHYKKTIKLLIEAGENKDVTKLLQN